MNALEKISTYINRILLCLAGSAIITMAMLICANIFLRLVWTPVKGTFELMGFFSAVATSFALGYTQAKKAHIGIDIMVKRFSPAIQKIAAGINYFICLLFFAFTGWQVARWATNLWKTGEVTETLRIIYYPFTYAVSFGCFILSFVLFVDLLKLFSIKEQS